MPSAADIEHEVRALASQRGFTLRRGQWPNGGRYQLTDDQGRPVLGSRFDASLQAVHAFLQQDAAEREMRTDCL